MSKLCQLMGGLAILVLLAAPAVGDEVVRNGVDAWRTLDDGLSFMDFSYDPIPAGFFCGGSEPFTGRINWKGMPLVTNPPEAFGGADTIIYRLDNALFDREGVATTRLQVAALSLVGTIETSCGAFKVRANLAPGVQPTTEMRIVRTKEEGGYYEAPLSFTARLTFTRLKGKGERLEIDRPVSFLATPGALWMDKPKNPGRKAGGFVLVDTDGDRRADTFLPGTSNFFPAGRGDLPQKYTLCDDPRGGETMPHEMICHDSGMSGKCHCTTINPE